MAVELADKGRFRWKAAAIIVALYLVFLSALHNRQWIESYIAAYLTGPLTIIALLAVLIWFGFFSGLSRRTRIITILAFVGFVGGAVLAAIATTRVEGTYSGVGVPRLVWKWSPRAGEGIGPLPSVTGDLHESVDLSTTPQDFPEFLGPGRHNAIAGIGLSRDWSHPPRQLWRQAIGLGWSSFAVVGNWAVTQEQRGSNEMVVCYDVTSGRPCWEHTHENTRFSEWQGGDGPRATPTISGGRVYVMGATGILDCLDGATGKAIWSRNVLADTNTGNLTYGKSCSPLVAGDLVIVTGGRGGPSLLAYHIADGSPAWTGGDETPGFASPVLATIAGVPQVLTINADSATAHASADGHVLWRFNWPGSMPKDIQPVALEPDRVLLSAGYGLGTLVLREQLDGSLLSIHTIWANRYLKPKLSNVTIHGGHVYGLDDGILTCLDLPTGKRMWRGDEYGFGQLLAVDDLLLIQSESGDVALVAAVPDGFHEIGRFAALTGKTWQGPALSGHRLLVRNDHEAACYELP